jgi:integrase
MIQQGQVFKLKTKGPDGQPLWAYRYRLDGRGSERPQVGGFATRAEAEKALKKVLDRLGPSGGRATITLADLVDEYLALHQAAPVTIAKLRWLLGRATSVLGGTRLADLSPRDVYAWRLAVPEGHRFEATQALRQVLNRAVDWGLIDRNPAKCGIRNTPRRAREKRPFESWQQVETVAGRLGPVYGPMAVFAAATGLRPSELFGLERRDVDRDAGVVYVRRAYANGRLKHTKTRLSNRAVPLQAKALEALDRLPHSESEILFANTRAGRIDFRSFGRRHWKPAQQAAGIEPLRDLYDLRHTYATFALRAGVPRLRRLPLHGLERRHDRPPLRPPRPRQPSARRLAPRRTRPRTGGGRCVDVAASAAKASRNQRFTAAEEALAPARRRSVDVTPRHRRQTRRQKELISRNFSEAL